MHISHITYLLFQLISEVDDALKFSIVVEGKLSLDDIDNYEEVRLYRGVYTLSGP